MMNVDKDREARRSITECTPMTHVYVGSLPDDAESHHHCTTEMAEEDAVLETAKGRHTGTPAEKAKAPGKITSQHTQKQGYDAKSSGGRAQTRVQTVL